MVVNEDGVHSLIITKASPLDAGVYTCLAENKGGQNSFNVNLRVLGKWWLLVTGCIWLYPLAKFAGGTQESPGG